MPDGESLWITEDVVQHVLDLPTGSIKELPIPDIDSAADEYQKMYLALKYVVATYKKEKEEKMAKGKEKDPAIDEEQTADEEQAENEEQPVSQAADQEQPVSQQQEDEGPPSVAEMKDYFIPGNILLLFQHSGKEDVAKLVTPQMLARLFLGIVLEKTLLSGTCNYVSSTTLQAVHNLDKLTGNLWSLNAYKHLYVIRVATCMVACQCIW
jgi:hypothetical protein